MMRTERMMEVLKQVEWVGGGPPPWRQENASKDELTYPPAGPGRCPWCEGWESEGHHDDCKLEALLNEGQHEQEQARSEVPGLVADTSG